jgi:hypothetical protein
MTKSEQTPEKGFSGNDEFSLQPFPVFGHAKGSSDETAKLASENVRLQRLVAGVVLVKNPKPHRYRLYQKQTGGAPAA